MRGCLIPTGPRAWRAAHAFAYTFLQKKLYFQNPQLLSQIDNMVLEEQVVEWLVEKATQTVVRKSFSELSGA